MKFVFVPRKALLNKLLMSRIMCASLGQRTTVCMGCTGQVAQLFSQNQFRIGLLGLVDAVIIIRLSVFTLYLSRPICALDYLVKRDAFGSPLNAGQKTEMCRQAADTTRLGSW